MRALALLLTQAALPFGVLCLRLSERSPSTPEPTGADESLGLVTPPLDEDSAKLSDHSLTEYSEDGKVLPIDQYRTTWNTRYTLESRLRDPLPSSIKLILGVFTVAQDAEYREVVRQTWLQQTGVCYWHHSPRDGCSVYTAFVIGKNGTGSKDVHLTDEEIAKAHGEPGMFVLNTTENMNGGKSLVWFLAAVKMFPWATHIAKMDMDTYPFLHKLVHRMNTNRSCVEKSSKYEFIGRPHNTFGPVFREACPYEECQGQLTSGADHCRPVALVNGQWRFLSGEFYIMSLPLAQELTWAGEAGTEDLFLTTRVSEAAKANHFCVTLRRLDSWFHRSRSVDAKYGNEF